MEEKAAVDSGVCVVAEEGGTVERSTSTEITVRQDDGKLKKYKLTKFQRSNQSNCYNQRPIVFKGDRVEKGEVIADGPSTSNGELGLGKNPLIGFMTWEGYNYEDAVLLSERLVQMMYIHLFILKNMKQKHVIQSLDQKRSHVTSQVSAMTH